MLKNLRKTFTLITCALLSVVILAILGTSFISSYSTLHGTVESVLGRALETSGFEPPVLGGKQEGGADDDLGHIVLAKVIVSEDGSVAKVNANAADVEETALKAVVSHVTEDGETNGVLATMHLAWDSTDSSEGTIIAIADTTTIDNALRTQVVNDCILFLVLILMVSFASWELSSWALRPVEKSWEQQRRFVADASHELKTPLAVILANTQILSKEEAGIPEESHRWVESTSDEATRMKRLVEDLLELARSEDAADHAKGRTLERVDLSDLIEGIALQYDAVAFENGCTIESNVTENVGVKGDSAELERLIKTLFDNAMKYAEKGSAVTCGLRRDGKQARFFINNHGEPIPAEDLPHVFERFYRSDKARTADDSSSFGLGLAIAKNVAEANGGTIVVTSDAVSGTTFTVSLPIAS